MFWILVYGLFTSARYHSNKLLRMIWDFVKCYHEVKLRMLN